MRHKSDINRQDMKERLLHSKKWHFHLKGSYKSPMRSKCKKVKMWLLSAVERNLRQDDTLQYVRVELHSITVRQLESMVRLLILDTRYLILDTSLFTSYFYRLQTTFSLQTARRELHKRAYNNGVNDFFLLYQYPRSFCSHMQPGWLGVGVRRYNTTSVE